MTTPEPRPRKDMAKRLREATAAGQCIVLQDREALKVADWLEADEKPLLQIEEAADALLETGVIDPASLDVTKEILRKTLQAATSKTTG